MSKKKIIFLIISLVVFLILLTTFLGCGLSKESVTLLHHIDQKSEEGIVTTQESKSKELFTEIKKDIKFVKKDNDIPETTTTITDKEAEKSREDIEKNAESKGWFWNIFNTLIPFLPEGGIAGSIIGLLTIFLRERKRKNILAEAIEDVKLSTKDMPNSEGSLSVIKTSLGNTMEKYGVRNEMKKLQEKLVEKRLGIKSKNFISKIPFFNKK